MTSHSATHHERPSRPRESDPPDERDTLPERDSFFDRETEPNIDVEVLRAALTVGLR